MKSGRTAGGARAASSHTAALASSDRAADALFAQTGIIRVDTLAEFFAVARLLATQPIPAGNKIGILTNAGGPAIMAVDAAEAAGLEVPRLSEATQARLRAVLPRAASVTNPVDMIASAGPAEYRACLEAMLDEPGLDALLSHLHSAARHALRLKSPKSWAKRSPIARRFEVPSWRFSPTRNPTS